MRPLDPDVEAEAARRPADEEERFARERGLYEGWSYDQHRADMDRLWRDDSGARDNLRFGRIDGRIGMPGVGVGGLLSGLFNPGLDDRLAQHITPNPNPLAQQGQPGQPGTVDSLGNRNPPIQPSGPPAGPQGPNLAPAAVTAPDPVNASYAADLLKASRMDALSADF